MIFFVVYRVQQALLNPESLQTRDLQVKMEEFLNCYQDQIHDICVNQNGWIDGDKSPTPPPLGTDFDAFFKNTQTFINSENDPTINQNSETMHVTAEMIYADFSQLAYMANNHI